MKMSYAKKSRSLKDDDGNLILAAAFIIPALMAIGGLAIDLRRGNNASNELQASLDAAALAALGDESVTNANVSAFAQSFVTENMDAKCVPSVTGTKQDGKVTVSGTCILDTTLLVYINKPTITVSEEAIAEKSGSSGSPCVLALSDKNRTAIMMNSQGGIYAPTCGVHANAPSKSAIFVNSGAYIAAESICTTGKLKKNGGAEIWPNPTSYCPSVTDPFASLSIPENADGPCERLNLQVSFNQEIPPGVYCGNTIINNHKTLTLQPGTHIFRNGPIILNSGARIVGNDVTLYFHDKKSNILANSRVDLEIDAPDTGPYAGIAVFQNQTIKNGPQFIINSGSNSYIEGVYYTPRSQLTLNSDSGFNTKAAYSMVIMDSMIVNAGAALNINSDYGSATPLPDVFSEGEPRLTH